MNQQSAYIKGVMCVEHVRTSDQYRNVASIHLNSTDFVLLNPALHILHQLTQSAQESAL